MEDGLLVEDLKHPLEVLDFARVEGFDLVRQNMLEDIGIGRDRIEEIICIIR